METGTVKRLFGIVALCILVGCVNRTQAQEIEIVAAEAPRIKATIVIPDKALPVETYAADELQYHIEKATGVLLPVAMESKASPTGHTIYLGACKKTGQAGIDVSTLEANARIIRTVGSDLFIAGRDSDGDVLKRFHTNYTRCGTLFGVYDFLEKELGVRWLWPGELGEHIPKTAELTSGKWNETVLPKLKHSRLRSETNRMKWWPTQELAERYHYHALPQWKRRQRFSQAISLEYGHAYIKYWERFGKTNPEFFALKPNGKREPTGTATELIQMCVSNEGFQDQVIKDWLARGKKWNADMFGPLMLNGCENDKRPFDSPCTCSGCKAWDAKNAQELTGHSPDLIDSEKSSNLKVKRHSLTDRYTKFWLALREKARLHDPDAKVFALAYSVYTLPPLETRLNKNILIGVVFNSGTLIPHDNEELGKCIKIWDEWANTGASLFFRPNSALGPGYFPFHYAGDLAKLFSHCYKNGMIATDFNSLTGQWSVQGPSLYLLARIHEHPDWSTEKILDEYYSGFGPAGPAVRNYFRHWEKVTKAVNPEQYGKWVAETHATWKTVYKFAGRVFTPQVMQEGERLLARAERSAAADPVALRRVAFLQNGLKHVQLMLKTQEAYVNYKKKGDVLQFAAALEKLDSFRGSVEKDFIADQGNNYWSEAGTWSRELIKMLGKGSKDLPDTWKFMWDPENKGESENWQTGNFDDSKWFSIGVNDVWEKQPVGKKWAKEHGGVGYNGLAWYRNAFKTEPGKRYTLIFGAVDEACVIWLNGRKILTRPFPYKGNRESWETPFEIDITDYIRFDRPNILAVRVEDNAGAGGIWKGVRLAIAAAPADISSNLLQNPGFEQDRKPWNKSVVAGKWKFAVDNKVSYGGNSSARLECTQVAPYTDRPQKSNAWARYYQAIPVEKGKEYKFRCFVRTEPKFGGEVRIFFTGDVEKKTRTVRGITTQGLWRELKIDNYVAADDKAGIYLNQYGLGKVWFDDIEVTENE